MKSRIAAIYMRITGSVMLGALFILVTCTNSVRAQSHVAEPAVNLGETTFLDGIAGPGLLLEEIGEGTHSGEMANGSGQTTPVTPAADSVNGTTHIAWLSKRTLLGAWYGVEVVAVAAHVHAGAGASAGGWGDLTVSPFILQWKEQKIDGIRVDQRIVMDFDLPTGEYRRDSTVSLSSHSFRVHPYYAITAFPTKHWETSWRVHCLWNSTNDAPPFSTMARSTQAGQAVHFNATSAYALPHGVWVGANGYYLKQVTAPRSDGLALSDSPEQVGAIGPGVLWDRGKYLLYANFYHEIGAENRPEGDKLVLRVQWIPGRKMTP